MSAVSPCKTAVDADPFGLAGGVQSMVCDISVAMTVNCTERLTLVKFTSQKEKGLSPLSMLCIEQFNQAILTQRHFTSAASVPPQPSSFIPLLQCMEHSFRSQRESVIE